MHFALKQIIEFISEYTDVSEDEIAAMAAVMHIDSIQKNVVFHQQGKVVKRIGLILEGAVRTYYVDDKGQEHTVGLKFENYPLVSIDSFTQQTPAMLNAITLEPTVVVWTSRQEFFDFLETYPKYEKVLRNVMSRFLTFQSEHVKLLRITSPRERYEMLCKNQPEVIKRVPLKYVASYLDMAMETLSRVRSIR